MTFEAGRAANSVPCTARDRSVGSANPVAVAVAATARGAVASAPSVPCCVTAAVSPGLRPQRRQRCSSSLFRYPQYPHVMFPTKLPFSSRNLNRRKCVNFRLRARLKRSFLLVYISVADCHDFCFSLPKPGVISLIVPALLFAAASSAQTPSALQPNLKIVPPRTLTLKGNPLSAAARSQELPELQKHLFDVVVN